jgi:hypothetical protein
MSIAECFRRAAMAHRLSVAAVQEGLEMPTPHDDSPLTVEQQVRDGSWIPTPTPRQILVASIRVRSQIAAMAATDTIEHDRIA